MSGRISSKWKGLIFKSTSLSYIGLPWLQPWDLSQKGGQHYFGNGDIKNRGLLTLELLSGMNG